MYFKPKRVFDPMTGSGTCRDVCAELGIPCTSADIRDGFDCANPEHTRIVGKFDFVWIHSPYWRMKAYSQDPHELSAVPDLQTFLTGLWKVIVNCRDALVPGGRMAVLMGDYSDLYRIQRFHERYPDLRACDMRPFHVMEWADSYQLSRTSRRNYLRSVKRCMKWAKQQGYIESNPIADLEVPAADHKQIVITPDDFETMLCYIRDETFEELVVTTW